ncbi:MAG: hypothetical protein ABSF56_01915 [Minisyncoccia bacterium]
MNTKTLSPAALAVIDQYLHFKVGSAICSVPYFNNKTVGARMTLRAKIGKGSPEDILDETQSFMVKHHVSTEALADESLKKLLVDNDIGIDCSAFVYYVLSAENEEQGKGPLDGKISFVNCKGLFGKMRCSMQPAENCDVDTLTHDENSRIVALRDARPGDFVAMTTGQDNGRRNHILVVHQVEYRDQTPVEMNYSHAVAYPEDGLYGNGVKQGSIEITDPDKPIIEERWIEEGKEGIDNRLLARAKASKTELRRLKWL